ncbi:uncharacterized protein LOC134187216 [Corticium candelabrum]|uniref:uncharacterized protein LOC134187216 n=1 Tax=Corticium candelabrum TaxID=121492 RepID=UPI002E258B07|nr:uncharacterized protein LOC134187216 [Corticium candelabrum]
MAVAEREHLAWVSVFMEVDDMTRYEQFRSALRCARLLHVRNSHVQQLDFLLSQRSHLIQGAKWEKLNDISVGASRDHLWPLSIWLPLPVGGFYFQAAFPGQGTVRLDGGQSVLEYELLLYRPDGVGNNEDDTVRANQVISQWAIFKYSRIVRICVPLDSIVALSFHRLGQQSLAMLCVEVNQTPRFEWQLVLEALGIGQSRDRDDFTPHEAASRCGRHYIFANVDSLAEFVVWLLSCNEGLRERQFLIRDMTRNISKEIGRHLKEDGVGQSGQKSDRKSSVGSKSGGLIKMLARQQSTSALQLWQKISKPVVSGKFRMSHRWSKQNIVSPGQTPRQAIIAVLVKHGLVSPALHGAPPKDASDAEQLPFTHNNFLGNDDLVKNFNPCFVDYLNFLCEDASELDTILATVYDSRNNEGLENSIVTATQVLLAETHRLKSLDYYFSLCVRVALPCSEYKHCLRCHKCVSWRYWHCYACEMCSRGQTSMQCQNCLSGRRFAAEGSDAELLARYETDKPNWHEFS